MIGASQHRSKKTRMHYRCFMFFTALVGVVVPALGIARAPNGDVGLPAAARNAVVRITGSHVEGPANDPERVTERGSGVVIDIFRDATGNRGWVCVLTADHVTGQQLENPGGQNWRDREWRLGLGNGTLAGGPWITMNNANQVFRPAADVNGRRVDLTVLGFRVNDVRTLTTVQIGQAAVAGNRPLTVAGYGDDAAANGALVNGSRNYTITAPNDQGQRYGTYRDGPNGLDAIQNSPVVPIGVVNYQYSALVSDLDFQPANGNLPITAGEAHFLTGDSGGPTFQMDADGNLRVVGIHSASQTQNNAGTGDGYIRVLETSAQLDVNLNQYAQFITDSCRAISLLPIPEPNTLTLLVLVGAGLLRSRRSAHNN